LSVQTTLTSLSRAAASNGPDGSTDAPSTLDDQLRYHGQFIAEVRDGAHLYASSISGTNTITGTISTSPTAYVTGQVYRFVAAGANTGAVTLNLNSIGAKAITKKGTSPLVGGELLSGACIEVMYDGTQFQLIGAAHLVGSTTTASTSGTYVEFLNVPSHVMRVSFNLSGVSTSGTSSPIVQIGDSGGVEATGYNCVATLLPNGGATSNSSFTAGFGISSTLASNVLYGRIVLERLDAASNLWTAQGSVSVPSGPSTALLTGSKALSATLDRVRLTTLNGTDTFDAGSVSILYE
jgi:hypothetical protein